MIKCKLIINWKDAAAILFPVRPKISFENYY